MLMCTEVVRRFSIGDAPFSLPLQAGCAYKCTQHRAFLMSSIPIDSPWMLSRDGCAAGRALYERHYSCSPATLRRRQRRGTRLFAGPGEKIVLLLKPPHTGLFVWRKYIPSHAVERVLECSIFRNESGLLSSKLVLEAERWAAVRWSGEQARTFVNARAVGGDGLCFKAAGWRKAGKSKGGLRILTKVLAS